MTPTLPKQSQAPTRCGVPETKPDAATGAGQVPETKPRGWRAARGKSRHEAPPAHLCLSPRPRFFHPKSRFKNGKNGGGAVGAGWRMPIYRNKATRVARPGGNLDTRPPPVSGSQPSSMFFRPKSCFNNRKNGGSPVGWGGECLITRECTPQTTEKQNYPIQDISHKTRDCAPKRTSHLNSRIPNNFLAQRLFQLEKLTKLIRNSQTGTFG